MAQARALFSQIGFAPKRIRATPLLLFPLLRRVVALDERGNVIMANYALKMERPPNPLKQFRYENSFIDQALSQRLDTIQSISDGFYYVDMDDEHLHF